MANRYRERGHLLAEIVVQFPRNPPALKFLRADQSASEVANLTASLLQLLLSPLTRRYVRVYSNHADWSSTFIDQNFSLTTHPAHTSIRLRHAELNRVRTTFPNCVVDRVLYNSSVVLVQHSIKNFRRHF